MTREEAIKNIKEHCYFANLIPQAKEALDMAIKALEQEPCEDCISRQAVLNLIVANHTELNGVNVVMYSPLYKDIKQLPPVTLQPKIGHWILSDGYWRCSNCKGKALLKFDNFGIRTPEYIHVESNYCPNCGAKMTESEDKE